MSTPLLLSTVVIYGWVAVDMWRIGNGMGWMGGAFFFYACANICFAMAAQQGAK